MVIKAISDFRHGKNAYPSRGQLDSQRDAVNLANDRLDGAGDILAQLEAWLHVAGSIGKKPGRVRRSWPGGWAVFLHGQRGHLPYQLSLEAKWRTACGHDHQGWAAAQQHPSHTPARTPAGPAGA